ncbi:unnamed protein product [Brassicogethes aeneus]|uniref:Uncharacterized protein n=1 Tax=Brassicogethes aeneus TaxID=1431903 RepID=A0A9P0B828_BRAAE|nr:unnamed protein product [Brassicogethes aeneus]
MCRSKLNRWSMGHNIYLPFSTPMLWREQQNHVDDCNFCLTNVMGINSKNLESLKYPEVLSVSKPVPRHENIPLPVLPTTHISMEALEREGPGFQYLIKLFPKISYEKIKEGIFIGPDIRKLINDDNFTKCSPTEAAAWASFKSVVRNFLGNRKSKDYKAIVADLLDNYFKTEPIVTRKESPYIKICRKLNYQGFSDEGMLSDDCWSLIRETNPYNYKKPISSALQFKMCLSKAIPNQANYNPTDATPNSKKAKLHNLSPNENTNPIKRSKTISSLNIDTQLQFLHRLTPPLAQSNSPHQHTPPTSDQCTSNCSNKQSQMANSF